MTRGRTCLGRLAAAAMLSAFAGGCGPTSVAPREVGGLTDVTAIAIGVGQTCAIVEGGGVRCLGSNESGELGNGATGAMVRTPQTVIDAGGAPLAGATQLEAFDGTTCARIGASEWSCWGDDPLGVLETSRGAKAKEVPFLRGATTMTLGSGERDLDYNEPGTSVDPATVIDFSYVCGTFETAVRCRTARRLHVDAEPAFGTFEIPLARARAVASGTGVFCILTEPGEVLCNTIHVMRRRPVESTPTATCDEDWSTCEETREETQRRVVEVTDALKLEDTGGEAATAMGAGAQHACALTTSGHVECLGLTTSGEAGQSWVKGDRIARTRVGGLASIEEIAVGDAFSCARTTSGEIRCWGNNSALQLGADHGGLSSETPVAAKLPDAAHAMAAGRQHACAVVGDDRRLFCWGSSYTVP